MSIADKILQLKQDFDEVYEAGKAEGGDTEAAYEQGVADGKKAEYDEFWDGLQQNGNGAVDYRYMFFYWSNDIYNPKYPIYSTKASMQACFQNARILDTLVDIDLSKTVNASSFFGSCAFMHTVRKLIVAETTNLNGIFQSCLALENITVEGTIGSNGINLQWSTKLSKASVTSIISCLSTTTSGLSITLSKTAVDNAFATSEGAADGSTSSEWLNLIATRSNWTISLV